MPEASASSSIAHIAINFITLEEQASVNGETQTVIIIAV
jgi:hypothetical protein